MYQIQNDYITAKFNSKGAELQSVLAKNSNINYIWEGDPNYWAKFSPVLFPIVGALKDDTYLHEGKTYHLPRHGFARDMVFEVKQISATEIEFVLLFDDETLAKYPFEFKLTINYTLVKNALKCVYTVENLGHDKMFFSLGAHPAFAAPLNGIGSYLDYYLLFNNDEVLTSYQIEENLLTNKTETILLVNGVLPLKHELFYQDALVFKDLKSTSIKLLNTKNKNGIELQFSNFPYFGIWAAVDADFVCLEPWCGIADTQNHNNVLADKKGIVALEASDIWKRDWKVSYF